MSAVLEEITIEHRGEEFILVPASYGYELMTADYLPVANAYPVSPKTGRRYSVGNIEYVRPRYHRATGRMSEGWASPQIRLRAVHTPEEAAKKLLSWLDRKAKDERAGKVGA